MNILTIGGATQDIFLQYEGSDFMTITKKNMVANYMLFESGEKKELHSIRYDTGGGSTNAAVSFARLGFNTSCFCNIGDDAAGKTVQSQLNQAGVDTSYMQTDSNYPTGQSFIINSQEGESTIFAYRGANRHLPVDRMPIDYLKTCKHLYITSLSHESANLLPQITDMAKQHNIPIAINPGVSQLEKGTQVLKQSLANIDIFILNSAEAQIFMLALVQSDESYQKTLECSKNGQASGINMESDQAYLINNPLVYADRFFSIRQFFKEVLRMGPRIVVVTNGRNGVYIASENQILFYPSITTKVVNTVGGGDAFGSCFVASLLLGYSLEDALINGNINSSSVLQNQGAKGGLLNHNQLEDLRQKVDKSLLQRCDL